MSSRVKIDEGWWKEKQLKHNSVKKIEEVLVGFQ